MRKRGRCGLARLDCPHPSAGRKLGPKGTGLAGRGPAKAGTSNSPAASGQNLFTPDRDVKITFLKVSCHVRLFLLLNLAGRANGLFMRDLSSWSFPLGRWGNVRLRLHVFFILFGMIAFTQAAQEGALPFWAGCLLLLLLSAMIHEAGHMWAARRVGGRVDQLVFWPLGGLTPVAPSHDPHAELLIALAGPMANLLVCIILAPLAFLIDIDLLHISLVSAPWVEPFGWRSVLALSFWMNWLVAVVNLLPAPPLDGGRALRAAVWARTDYRHAVQLGKRAAVIAAVGLGLGAYWAYDSKQPLAWVSLVLLAIVCYFSAKFDAERLEEPENEEDTYGLELSGGFGGFESHQPERNSPSLLSQWRERRREKKRLEQLRQEHDEERRLDEILARVHECGLNSLSDEERGVLIRASRRYRSRIE